MNLRAHEMDEKIKAGEIFRLASADSFTRETVDDDIILEGWFTTETVNSSNQIVKAKAFKWDNGLKKFNGRVLAFHDQRKEPIGMVEKMKIVLSKGLWGRIRLFREAPASLKRAINEGVLNGLSIGFGVEEYTYDEKTEVMTFTRCILYEVSVVNIGANEEALFEVVHSIMGELADAPRHTFGVEENNKLLSQRSKHMADDKKMVVDPEYLQLDHYETEKQQIQSNIDEVKKMSVEIQEEQKKLRAGIVTKADFLTKMELMSKDLEKLARDIEIANNKMSQDKELVEHFTFSDHHSLLELGKYDWLKTHDGLPFNEVQYRAYRLFQMPVDYKAHSRGQELINLRNLHDAMLCVDRWHCYHSAGQSGGGRYRIENQPLWNQFRKAVEPFDSVVAHAMAGGNAGYGAEWVPTEFSAEFNEFLRVQPNLPNKFKWWVMPTSGSGYYPFQNGRATVYLGGESLVDNAAQARKTNIATGQKLFTPKLFIGALVSSENLIEDSIIDMVTMIRQELTTAILEGLEDAIINGDTTAAHMDDVHTTTYTPAYSIRKAIDGLRHQAVADTATYDSEVPSGDTALDALTINGIQYAINLMGVPGLDTANCLFITGLHGKEQFYQALIKEDVMGILPYLISGVLPPIGGVSTYISGMYEEAQDSDGFYNDGTAAATSYHTSFLCVHLPSFRIAQRRGITLEMSKDILTQQQQFVATGRFDFGKVCASTLDPCVAGINCQWKA